MTLSKALLKSNTQAPIFSPLSKFMSDVRHQLNQLLFSSMVFAKAMLVWIENVCVFCICHQLASENVLKDFAGHAGQADGSVDSCDILLTFWNECPYRLSLFSRWVEPHLLHFLNSLLFILINLCSFYQSMVESLCTLLGILG